MTKLLLWGLTMNREILETSSSFIQFQFNNISYQKSLVSMLSREFRLKFLPLNTFYIILIL